MKYPKETIPDHSYFEICKTGEHVFNLKVTSYISPEETFEFRRCSKCLTDLRGKVLLDEMEFRGNQHGRNTLENEN